MQLESTVRLRLLRGGIVRPIITNLRHWLNGTIARCQRVGPGSIPGWRIYYWNQFLSYSGNSIIGANLTKKMFMEFSNMKTIQDTVRDRDILTTAANSNSKSPYVVFKKMHSFYQVPKLPTDSKA